MKLEAWLMQAIHKLQTHNIASARIDTLILLEDAINKNRAWILAHPDEVLDDQTVDNLNSRVSRRSKYEPLAYIRGKSEFYGREFAVSSHTLQPRPETETMIELLRELIESRKLKVESRNIPNDETIAKNQQPKGEQDTSAMTIVDVGTGSGCIAITAKLLYPNASVIATDIDKKCLAIARKNSTSHSAEVDFFEGNLLEPLCESKRQAPDILLANLPYVPDDHTINQDAMHEPRRAIFGGKDGLELYQSLFNQSANLLPFPAQWIVTESLPKQHQKMEQMASKHSYALYATEDLIQVFYYSI